MLRVWFLEEISAISPPKMEAVHGLFEEKMGEGGMVKEGGHIYLVVFPSMDETQPMVTWFERDT